jgi:hypothetical protein
MKDENDKLGVRMTAIKKAFLLTYTLSFIVLAYVVFIEEPPKQPKPPTCGSCRVHGAAK